MSRRPAPFPRSPLRLTVLVLCAAVLLPAPGCAPPPRRPGVVRTAMPAPRADKTGLRVVFEDDFRGSSLDPRRWHSQLAWGRSNKDELQYYAPGAVQVKDGMLTITARRQNVGRRRYTSGAIASYGLYEFTYGYVEARARIPKGQGLWPAFWLLSAKKDDPTEIDISEFVGANPYRIQTTLHYGEGKDYRTRKLSGPDYSAGFHVYAVDWRPDRIVWYVDGVELFRVTDHVPNEPMYIIANLSIGGAYTGRPDTTTVLPATYTFDYIRVYRRD